MVRRFQPERMINHRNDDRSDFQASETAAKPPPRVVAWEGCLTLNKNLVWRAGDHDYKNASDVLKLTFETSVIAGNPFRHGALMPDDKKRRNTGRLVIHGVPSPLTDPIAMTIAIDVAGEPEALRPQTSFWIPG